MSSPKVFVVEDDVSVARDMVQTLEELGYGVSGVARSGEEAVIGAAESGADLVLMDIGLPGDLDGIDAARVLRTTLDLPVIYVAGLEDESTFRRADRTRPYGYVRKPFDRQDIRNAVELAIQRRGSETGRRRPGREPGKGLIDALTLLHSRSALELEAIRAIEHAAVEDERVAFVLVDLVDFARGNERYGRAGGDDLLSQVARRLQLRCRPEDVAARLEDDRFALLLVGVRNVSSAERAGRRVLDAFEQPFYVQGRPVHLDARVAVAVYPDHAGDAAELLDLARRTMESVKDEKASVLHVYFGELG